MRTTFTFGLECRSFCEDTTWSVELTKELSGTEFRFSDLCETLPMSAERDRGLSLESCEDSKICMLCRFEEGHALLKEESEFARTS